MCKIASPLLYFTATYAPPENFAHQWYWPLSQTGNMHFQRGRGQWRKSQNGYNICSWGRNREVSAEINCLLHESHQHWLAEATQIAAQIWENKLDSSPPDCSLKRWNTYHCVPSNLHYSFQGQTAMGFFKVHDVPMQDTRFSKNPLSDLCRLVTYYGPCLLETHLLAYFPTLPDQHPVAT